MSKDIESMFHHNMAANGFDANLNSTSPFRRSQQLTLLTQIAHSDPLGWGAPVTVVPPGTQTIENCRTFGSSEPRAHPPYAHTTLAALASDIDMQDAEVEFVDSTAAPRGDNRTGVPQEASLWFPPAWGQGLSSGPSMATFTNGFVVPPRDQQLPPNVTPIYYPPPPPLPPPAPLFSSAPTDLRGYFGPSMTTTAYPSPNPLPPNAIPIRFLPPSASLFRNVNSRFLPEPFVIRTGNDVPPPHPLLSSSTFQSASGVKQIQGAFDQPVVNGEKADCPICMEREAIFTSVACGHSLCCKCAQQLQQCPSCRKPYGLIVRVYR